MKKIIYALWIALILFIVGLTMGGFAKVAPSFVYVYSDSMEPLIQVNDVFLVWPAGELSVGEIIMYRPIVLKAPFITHRIIGVGESGWLTKGDNSLATDQEAGEPEVKANQVVGKVFAINGQPLVISGLGKLSSMLQSSWGEYSKYLSIVFFGLAVLNILIGIKKNTRKPKPHNRLRLSHIYKLVHLLTIVVILLSVYMGSRVTQLKYLVSEYPNNLKEQVEVNKQGQVTLVIKNNGIVPVWPIAKGIPPLSVKQAPEFLGPLSEDIIVMAVEPQEKIGAYQGYVQLYNYPVLLPRKWLVALHDIHPLLPLVAIGMAISFWMTLLIQSISRVQGLEGWIPLKAIQDKMAARRMHRLKVKFRRGRRRRLK